MTGTDPLDQLWWLSARASGIVALVLVTFSVGLGLAMAGRLLHRPALRKVATRLHEQLAVTGLVAIAVHGASLLGDPWLHPGIAGVTVPFALGYERFFTGLGVIAGWLAALLGLSFYARRRIGTKRWRSAHRATAIVYMLGLAHALGSGTDGGAAWMRGFAIVTGVPILALLVRRLLPRPARRRAPVPAAS